ncbi:MAG: hypothetical protein Kow00102_05730 [Spirochaetota bacterium]|nr:phage morphogenesis protein [Spirochaetota bacterium]
MGLNFTGNWDFFDNAKHIDTHIREHMGNALETAAEIVRANVVKGIRDQRYPFAPLAQRTKEYKQMKGLSPLILIAEGDYLASFTTKKVSWDEVHIGSNHPQSRALEFGYEPRGLPARPHLGLALAESTHDVMSTLRDAFATMFTGLIE